MKLKERIKNIFKKWHYWLLVVGFTLQSFLQEGYSNIKDIFSNFSVSLGLFMGDVITFFIIYLIVNLIIHYFSKDKKD